MNRARTDDGTTPLLVASQNGDKAVVEDLIKVGADVDKAATDDGTTPLLVASQKGDKARGGGADPRRGAHVDKAATGHQWKDCTHPSA